MFPEERLLEDHMPELPEVETVVQGLQQILLHKKIARVNNSAHKLRYPYPPSYEMLLSKTIVAVRRMAKYILIHLEGDMVMIFHLGMTGRLLYHHKSAAPLKHDHVTVTFYDDSQLVFNDSRRFGLFTLTTALNLAQHTLFCKLGVEPLSNEFSAEYMGTKLQKCRSPIKVAIMDAKLVVGVGNIYASEALYMAQINPLRPAMTLEASELQALYEAIVAVLYRAINAKGSTLRNYRGANGDSGNFQNLMKVYGRNGQHCYLCAFPIYKIVQAGRSTFYCDECQT